MSERVTGVPATFAHIACVMVARVLSTLFLFPPSGVDAADYRVAVVGAVLVHGLRNAEYLRRRRMGADAKVVWS